MAISTVLVFIAMPIAIVLSPVISWIPRVLARAFLVCLAVPLVWSICFAASGALLNDGLFLKGSSGFFDALLEPLAAIALLWLMLVLPTRLAQMAMLGAGAVSGGFVSRAVSYAAGSQLREVSRQHLPGWAGGHGQAGQRGKETDSRLGARLRAESVLAASKAAAGAGGVAAAAGAAAGSASSGRLAGSNGPNGGATEHQAGWVGRIRGSGNPRAYSPPPLAGAEGAVAAGGGLQRPSWRQEDFDAEMLEASLREQHQPVSAEQAKNARDSSGVGDAGSGWQPDRRPGAAGASASGLPGARRVDAVRARGDPHPGCGEPRGQGAGIRPDRGLDDRVRREHRAGRRQRYRVRRQPSPGLGPASAGIGRGEQRGGAVARAAGRAPARWRSRLVNPAPAHLEAKLRFGWDFTVGQIAAMVGGILVGFAWANWLSPIGGIGGAVTGVYVGGLPVVAGFVASQTEFDLWAVVRAALGWRRAVGRFLPGAGRLTGYVVVLDEEERERGDGRLGVLDPDVLWSTS